MEWKLQQVYNDKVNVLAFSEELLKSRWHKKVKTAESMSKKVYELQHEHNFLRLRNPIDWYFMFRSWLDVTPFELTGAKTDEEAVMWIMNAKNKESGVTITGITIDKDMLIVVPDEVKEKYIGVIYRRDQPVVENVK
jgi:hypothetical protein